MPEQDKPTCATCRHSRYSAFEKTRLCRHVCLATPDRNYFAPPPGFSCSFYEMAADLGVSEMNRLEAILADLVKTHGAECEGARDALAAETARSWCKRLLEAARVEDDYGCPYCRG